MTRSACFASTFHTCLTSPEILAQPLNTQLACTRILARRGAGREQSRASSLQRLELLVEDVLVKLMQQMQQDTSERSSVANGVQEAQQGVQDPKSAKSSETDVKPKKPRKPYVLTRPREAWTPEEHQKFLEGLSLFQRDWKRLESHIGTKTAVQIRSHAQKHFQKALSKGEEIPPPRHKKRSSTGAPNGAAKGTSASGHTDGGHTAQLSVAQQYTAAPPSPCMVKTEMKAPSCEPPHSPNISSRKMQYGSVYETEQLSNTSGLPGPADAGQDADTAGNAVAKVVPACQGALAPAVTSMVPGIKDVKEDGAHAALHGMLATPALESAMKHKDGQRRTRPVLGFLGGLLDESTSNKDNFMAFQRLSAPQQELALAMMDNLSAQLPEPAVQDGATPLPPPSLVDMAALHSSQPISGSGTPASALEQVNAADGHESEVARPPKSPRLGASRYATDPFARTQFGTEGAQQQVAASMGDGMGQASGYLSSQSAQCWPSLAGMPTGNGTSGNSTSTMAGDTPGAQSGNNPMLQSSQTYGSTTTHHQHQQGSPVIKSPLQLQQLVTTGMPAATSSTPGSSQPHTPSTLAASSAPATHGTPGIRQSGRARKPNVRKLDRGSAVPETLHKAPAQPLMDSTASTALASPAGLSPRAYDHPSGAAMPLSAAGDIITDGLAGQVPADEQGHQVSNATVAMPYNTMPPATNALDTHGMQALDILYEHGWPGLEELPPPTTSSQPLARLNTPDILLHDGFLQTSAQGVNIAQGTQPAAGSGVVACASHSQPPPHSGPLPTALQPEGQRNPSWLPFGASSDMDVIITAAEDAAMAPATNCGDQRLSKGQLGHWLPADNAEQAVQLPTADPPVAAANGFTTPQQLVPSMSASLSLQYNQQLQLPSQALPDEGEFPNITAAGASTLDGLTAGPDALAPEGAANPGFAPGTTTGTPNGPSGGINRTTSASGPAFLLPSLLGSAFSAAPTLERGLSAFLSFGSLGPPGPAVTDGMLFSGSLQVGASQQLDLPSPGYLQQQ